jgi:phosphoesterase RecJ-like protein
MLGECDMSDYKKAYKRIKKATNIMILPHKDADGDALGCAYAMKLILHGMGKNADVLSEEKEPHKLFKVIEDVDSEIGNPDLIICVDSADLGRLGERAELLKATDSICFDHHKSCTEYSEINCVIPTAGACAELIYDFCIQNKLEITPEIANNLFLALSSDTGGFRQTNASPRTMEIAAALMRKGANSGKINTALFLSNTIAYTRVVGEVLSTLEFDEESGIALIKIKREQIEKYNCTPDDVAGIVNFARKIIGVKIAICLRELENGNVKASMRSNDDRYDVSELAAKFGGGGHLRAAGCELKGMNIDEAGEKILQVAKEYIKQRDGVSHSGIASE